MRKDFEIPVNYSVIVKAIDWGENYAQMGILNSIDWTGWYA